MNGRKSYCPYYVRNHGRRSDHGMVPDQNGDACSWNHQIAWNGQNGIHLHGSSSIQTDVWMIWSDECGTGVNVRFGAAMDPSD